MSTLLSAGRLPPNRHDDLENYGIDDLEDPFATPSPPSSPKKRKEPASQGLGIDQEVSVQKRVRVPRVKLDEDRLLGPAGLPKLRQRARDLKIKGKGHEFSDAARLLSFYQMWLDDLFPKAKFLDALAMVEKAGHKKRVVIARNELMNEGRPKPPEEEDLDLASEPVAAIDGHDAQARPVRASTPAPPNRDRDVPDDEDLYDATPRNANTSRRRRTDVPSNDDDDDLDALIAEAESQDRASPSVAAKPRHAPLPTRPDDTGEEDDLDALIAEAEAQENETTTQRPAQGRDGDKNNDNFAEEEAAMQEMDETW